MSLQQSFTRTVNGAEIEFTEPTHVQKQKIMRKASERVKGGEIVESVAEFEENIEFMVKAVSGITALRETQVKEMPMGMFCELFYYAVYALCGKKPDESFEQAKLESKEFFDGLITVYEDGTVET